MVPNNIAGAERTGCHMEEKDRLAQFEAMLRFVEEESLREKAQMDALKAAGKEKTATYRQYLANRLLYRQMLSLYRRYGLWQE